MHNDVILIDKLVTFDNDRASGDLIIEHTQEIPDEYLDSLRVQKAETIGTPMGELHKVASIPTNWVEEWQREGFDIMKESVQDILKRLRQKQLDVFITTTKRI
jgi:hypothetical protein